MSQKWERIVQSGEQLLKERAFSQAAKVFENALRVAEKDGDPELRIDSLQLLAMSRLECGLRADAEYHARRAIDIARTVKGAGSREYGQALQFLADLLIDMEDLERAEETVSESVEVIDGTFTSHVCDSCREAVMGVRTLQLEILLRQGKFEQATSCMRQMWRSNGNTGEFKIPSQEKLAEILQEFKEKRTLGKHWRRTIRSVD